ncbi:MAG: metal-sensing transcriptional repressor, partial [SAR324 cluster bacterium]|nr:metal-sensing transcriptional repressor [SAR324 cluster bacterium]
MNHPCHDPQVNRLKKIEGQVRGLQKMIEGRRYCMDIVS